jgi:two-component system nitrogen regulation response regulator GlnG
VAATNKDLEAMVAARQFREDLFYRLNVFRIRLPALRDRKDDIPLLVDYMLQRQAAARKGKPKRLSNEALEKLIAHDWPGNVRELENVIQRANVIAKGETILAKDLPQEVTSPRRSAPRTTLTASPAATVLIQPEVSVVVAAAPSSQSLYDAIYKQNRIDDGRNILNTIEIELIKRAMDETRGNQLRSSIILGINRSTLKKRLLEMQQAGIKFFT